MKLSGWRIFLALVMVIAAIRGLDRFSMLTSGRDSAELGPQTALRSDASAAPAKESFDYFPGRYTNECREPAESIAIF
jgi:hypothetical protein